MVETKEVNIPGVENHLNSVTDYSHFRLQTVVFALVAASFTNIYITQPVLPVLQSEFSADMVLVSFSVSAVILGIAISNLPFGALADRLPIHPIILTGGIVVAVAGLICALATDLWVLIGARFLQGIFIPSLTTCLADYVFLRCLVIRIDPVNVGPVFCDDGPGETVIARDGEITNSVNFTSRQREETSTLHLVRNTYLKPVRHRGGNIR